MKLSLISLLALVPFVATAIADCDFIAGNYYCNEVEAITYKGVGYDGSYTEITGMDSSSCGITSGPSAFSGPLAPFNEELSVHFRGPISLKQFAVYYPSSNSNQKREVAEDCSTTTGRHQHHVHKREPLVTHVVTNYVYVDENGNPIGAPSATTLETVVSDASSATEAAAESTDSVASSSSAPVLSSSTSTYVAEPTTAPSGSAWTRTSYYTPGSASNVVFLNNKGGAGSGVFDTCWGNSLSYCASNGQDAASSPEILSDVTVPSNIEYIIFSNSECSGDDCGYYRPGIPAYHGFGGASKIFLFEFQMPTDSSGGFNGDMPAVWLLNAKIPRTAQYSSASCWTTGCGEFDVFEILSAGSDKLITALHDKQNGNGAGCSDYFARPYDSTMKGAVIFDESSSSIYVLRLDDSTDFSAGLDEATVSSWLSKSGTVVSM